MYYRSQRRRTVDKKNLSFLLLSSNKKIIINFKICHKTLLVIIIYCFDLYTRIRIIWFYDKFELQMKINQSPIILVFMFNTHKATGGI